MTIDELIKEVNAQESNSSVVSVEPVYESSKISEEMYGNGENITLEKMAHFLMALSTDLEEEEKRATSEEFNVLEKVAESVAIFKFLEEKLFESGEVK